MDIKHAYRKTLQRGRARMIKKVNVIERDYKRVLPDEKEEIDGELVQKVERTAKTERSGPYLVVF